MQYMLIDGDICRIYADIIVYLLAKYIKKYYNKICKQYNRLIQKFYIIVIYRRIL